MPNAQALLTFSMKGGVGKTTIAIGLAGALPRRGLRVALLDMDIHGSDLPRALHLAQGPGYQPGQGGEVQPVRYEGFLLFSIGLLCHEDSSNLWDCETKDSAVKQIVTT